MTPKLTFFLSLCLMTHSIRAQDFKPNPGPEIPTITVTCEEVTVVFRRSSQWTPARFDFRGNPMSTERSAYGTVFLFPELGFIGTNHLENEPEELQSLSFIVDGKPIENPGPELTGKTFRFLRDSKIRDFRLQNEWEIRNDRIYETVSITAARDVPLKLVYPFMHAWSPTVSAYIAGSDTDPKLSESGELHDGESIARKFFINASVDWLAVYEPGSGQFAVSRLLTFPEETSHSSKIWNVPGTYRKQYLTVFSNQTVPKGFSGTWKMVTGFGQATSAEWKEKATTLAGLLLKDSESNL
jgi:hypothetical protein